MCFFIDDSVHLVSYDLEANKLQFENLNSTTWQGTRLYFDGKAMKMVNFFGVGFGGVEELSIYTSPVE